MGFFYSNIEKEIFAIEKVTELEPDLERLSPGFMLSKRVIEKIPPEISKLCVVLSPLTDVLFDSPKSFVNYM